MTPLSFLLLRLAIGANMLGHGIVRLPKLTIFSQWMLSSFSNSILPSFLVYPFSYVLPFVEFTIGILLIVGLFTKFALISGSIVMIILIFGTTLIENWEAIPSQLIHSTLFAVLLHYIFFNHWSLDKYLNK